MLAREVTDLACLWGFGIAERNLFKELVGALVVLGVFGAYLASLEGIEMCESLGAVAIFRNGSHVQMIHWILLGLIDIWGIWDRKSEVGLRTY